MRQRVRRAWLCLAFGSERQYAGNDGYNDQISVCYLYDSFVANHKQVSEGDIIVVRDRDAVLGIANVVSLQSGQGTKNMQRCPDCGTTSIKSRATMVPRFRCKNTHQFESPVQEVLECIKYEAHFGDSFRVPSKTVPVAELRGFCPRYSDQLSIQELEFQAVEKLIGTLLKEQGTAALLGLPFSERMVVATTREREPFAVDPDRVDRATFAHADLQNGFAAWLARYEVSPRLPTPDEPQYDLGWESDGVLFVCEMKSLTIENEEKQLRYGLGQLLRYRHRLATSERTVKGILVIERAPVDQDWVELCRNLDVFLVWPTLLGALNIDDFKDKPI